MSEWYVIAIDLPMIIRGPISEEDAKGHVGSMRKMYIGGNLRAVKKTF